MPMQLSLHNDLSSLERDAWNRLNSSDNPFLSYEFLRTLETTGCVGDGTGWIPQYVSAHIGDQLIAAIPMYIKYHSYGEYIFDWAWANAYQHHGLDYYPKLLIGIPFTPVTGSRLLIHPEAENREQLQSRLIEFCQQHAQHINASSIHCLFNPSAESQPFKQHGFMERLSNQFHWKNQNYTSFDHFLSTLTSRHRKKIKRERQRIKEQNISLRMHKAQELTQEQWQRFYYFYSTTCHIKGGVAYLNDAFFQQLIQALPDNILLATAYHNGEMLAASFFMHNSTTLYGRYWGSREAYHSLHFETCYYTPIDYCINHQISEFEAGAQGEHKLSRGFLPTSIHSNHWITNDEFRAAISHYLEHEKQHIISYQNELSAHSPFKTQQNHADRKPLE